MILTLQEPILVHLRSDLCGKGLLRRAQGGEKSVVGFVGGGGVHLLLAGRRALHTLEMQADVVVGGVRVRALLRMVLPPQLPPGIKYGARGFTGRTRVSRVRSRFGRAGARPSRFRRDAEIHVADDTGAVERAEEVVGNLVLQLLFADGRWITGCHRRIIQKSSPPIPFPLYVVGV